jgi:Family of unknown function (DUF5808)
MTMAEDDINREEWDNPANWGNGPWGLYFSKRDGRLCVPKRAVGTGWTINFGHRHATLSLLGMVLFPTLLMSLVGVLAMSLGAEGVLVFIGAVFVPLLLTFLVWTAIIAGRVAPKKDRGKDG